MSKKQIPVFRLKVRNSWSINPKTRIVSSKKIYNRPLSKQEINRIRQTEDF